MPLRRAKAGGRGFARTRDQHPLARGALSACPRHARRRRHFTSGCPGNFSRRGEGSVCRSARGESVRTPRHTRTRQPRPRVRLRRREPTRACLPNVSYKRKKQASLARPLFDGSPSQTSCVASRAPALIRSFAKCAKKPMGSPLGRSPWAPKRARAPGPLKRFSGGDGGDWLEACI